MLRQLTLLALLLNASVSFADSCRPDELLREGRPALPPSTFAKLDVNAPAGEIIKQLGPAARVLGSGIYILEWDITDGRVFTLSTSDFCRKAYRTNFIPAGSRDTPRP